MKHARPFVISGALTAIIMTVLSFFIEDKLQSKGTLVTGLIIAITIGAFPIYNIERWSLKKRSLIHFLIMLTAVLPLLLYSEWYSPLLTAIVFFSFGAVGWTAGYIVHLREKRHTPMKE